MDRRNIPIHKVDTAVEGRVIRYRTYRGPIFFGHLFARNAKSIISK